MHGCGYAFQGDAGQNTAVEEETPFVIVHDGREFGLQRGENLLGRSRACRVRLSDGDAIVIAGFQLLFRILSPGQSNVPTE